MREFDDSHVKEKSPSGSSLALEMDSGPYVVFRMCSIVVGEGSLVPSGTSERLMRCWLGSSGQIWGFSIHMLLPEQSSRQLPTSPRPQYSAALQTAYTPPATHSHLNLNFWLRHWTSMLSIWADCRLADHLCVCVRERDGKEDSEGHKTQR